MKITRAEHAEQLETPGLGIILADMAHKRRFMQSGSSSRHALYDHNFCATASRLVRGEAIAASIRTDEGWTVGTEKQKVRRGVEAFWGIHTVRKARH